MNRGVSLASWLKGTNHKGQSPYKVDFKFALHSCYEGFRAFSSGRKLRLVRNFILIMRAFVRLRQILSTHKELAQKLKELEVRDNQHD